MKAVRAEVDVCEERECREVELTDVAIDAGVGQGDAGHYQGRAFAMTNHAAGDARPVAGAWARSLPPRVQRRRASQGGLPLKESFLLGL